MELYLVHLIRKVHGVEGLVDDTARLLTLRILCLQIRGQENERCKGLSRQAASRLWCGRATHFVRHDANRTRGGLVLEVADFPVHAGFHWVPGRLHSIRALSIDSCR
jgi:hypothetical protein